MVRKTLVLSAISGLTLLGILAASPPEEGHYTNLKVLSKKITDEQMDVVMSNFNRQLGVNCLFCHVLKRKSPFLTESDFASDELINKRTAREMLRMSMRINKKYFNQRIDGVISTRPVVWCKTCHRGYSIPVFTKPNELIK